MSDSTLGTLSAADLGKWLTIHAHQFDHGLEIAPSQREFLRGQIVRVDHDCTWVPGSHRTFVGYGDPRDPIPFTQIRGARWDSGTPCTVTDEEPTP